MTMVPPKLLPTSHTVQTPTLTVNTPSPDQTASTSHPDQTAYQRNTEITDKADTSRRVESPKSRLTAPESPASPGMTTSHPGQTANTSHPDQTAYQRKPEITDHADTFRKVKSPTSRLPAPGSPASPGMTTSHPGQDEETSPQVRHQI